MNTLFCSPRGVLMSISFDACSALISIGSQPFAQVLLCFSSGALLLKNIGSKDGPNCWMANTIPHGRIGLFDRRSNDKDLYVSYITSTKCWNI